MASMAASLHGTSSYASPSCMANNIARALSVSERGGAAGHFPARFCFFYKRTLLFALLVKVFTAF